MISYLKFQLSQLTENAISYDGGNELIVGKKEVPGTEVAEEEGADSALISIHSCGLSTNIYRAPQYVPGTS